MTSFAFTISAFFMIYACFKFQGDDSYRFFKGFVALSAALVAGYAAYNDAMLAVGLLLVFTGITGGRIFSGRLVASDLDENRLKARSGLTHCLIKSGLSTALFVAVPAFLISVHALVGIFDVAIAAWAFAFAIDFFRRALIQPDWQFEDPRQPSRSAQKAFMPESSGFEGMAQSNAIN